MEPVTINLRNVLLAGSTIAAKLLERMPARWILQARGLLTSRNSSIAANRAEAPS